MKSYHSNKTMSIISAEIRQKIYPFFLYFPKYKIQFLQKNFFKTLRNLPRLKLKINKLTCIKPGTVYAENDNPKNSEKIYKPAQPYPLSAYPLYCIHPAILTYICHKQNKQRHNKYISRSQCQSHCLKIISPGKPVILPESCYCFQYGKSLPK